jgi:hypothetical protein
MWDHGIAEKLFERHKVNYWMAGCLVYGLLMGLCTIPPMPNGMLVGWFFDPHILYAVDTEGTVRELQIRGIYSANETVFSLLELYSLIKPHSLIQKGVWLEIY